MRETKLLLFFKPANNNLGAPSELETLYDILSKHALNHWLPDAKFGSCITESLCTFWIIATTACVSLKLSINCGFMVAYNSRYFTNAGFSFQKGMNLAACLVRHPLVLFQSATPVILVWRLKI